MADVTIWTDGSCDYKSGNGGWGSVLESGTNRKELYGPLPGTRTGAAELTAAINGIKALKGGPHKVMLITDSGYVCLAIEGIKRPLQNKELLDELQNVCRKHYFAVKWVSRHDGEPNNERAHELANIGRTELEMIDAVERETA